jgi:hypothetical protein
MSSRLLEIEPPAGLEPARTHLTRVALLPLSYGGVVRRTSPLAALPGFEPRTTDSESVVLPITPQGKRHAVSHVAERKAQESNL